MQPYTSTQVVHFTDTTDADAILKIRGAYARQLGKHGIYAYVDVDPAPNSVTIGTKLSEIVYNTEKPDVLVAGVNFAPPDNDKGTKDNVRNDFFCAKLHPSVGAEVYVCGTSNGLEFSYIKSDILEFYRVTDTNSLKSQFRSLQILPERAIAFSVTETRLNLIRSGIFDRIENVDDIVPSVPDVTHVLQVDNFGNVKLVLSQADRELLRTLTGENVCFAFSDASIEVGGERKARAQSYNAIVAPTLFAAPVGTNVVALRSSSTLAREAEVPIIATIRHFPAETLPNYPQPKVGAQVWISRNSTRG